MTLELHIKELISQNGPITMAEFMREALAHPEYGYYKTKEPFGAAGDFTTAPEISQMFGELIGIWCADMWQQMGAGEVQIVEIGPGKGTLMADFLRGTAHVPQFHDKISIIMVETSKRLGSIQYEKLQAMHPRVKWLENFIEIAAAPAIIVANELFDALPARQYVRQHGKWCEKMVRLDKAGEFEFVARKLRQDLEHLYNEDVADGAVLEVSADAIKLMAEISHHIKKHDGAALIIDYGYSQTDYKNTLSAISHHKHQHILKDIGNADISLHVDFTMLSKIAAEQGLTVHGAIGQGEFLKKMGIELRAEKLKQNATKEQQTAIESAKNRLVEGAQMGELFKVLAVTSKKLVPAGIGE